MKFASTLTGLLQRGGGAPDPARAAADRGADLSTALEAVAAAAQAGAESTKTLAARFGRAKNLGERSAGEQDPGATSLSLLFRGFAEGVK